MNSIWIVLPVLTLLMFELGLNLKWSDFKLFKTRPRPVIAGLIGQLVLLPLVAWLLARFMNLPEALLLGFILIGCCPGGSSSNVFSMLAKGDVALSVSLTACSSIITLFTIPLIMGLACAEVTVHLPIMRLFMQNIVLMFVPIIIGMAVQKRWPDAAAAIHKVLSKLAFPLIILLATVFFIQNRQAISDNFARLGIAASALIIINMGLGAGMSAALKLTGSERRTIVIEIGMQNAAQAIAIASSPFIFNNSEIAVPAIIYALMMNVILIIYVALTKLRK